MLKRKFVLAVGFGLLAVFFLCSQHDDKMAKTVVSNTDNLAVSIDGVSSDKLPDSGNYYLTKYKCYSSNTEVVWDRKKYKLSVTNKNKKAGVSCNLTFESNPLLSSMKQGSYVKYQGVGGKVGVNGVSCKLNGSASSGIQTSDTESPNSCLGDNAREDIDGNNVYGYCYNGNYKYYTRGWRIAYISKSSQSYNAVIIAAASPECVSSSSDNLLNTRALKYCNANYVDNHCVCDDENKDGLCDKKSKDVWNIGDSDFSRIIESSKKLDISSCLNNKSMIGCGYSNDLIDNGGYYWINSNSNFYWNPDSRMISSGDVKSYGLRPLVQLSSSVVVVDGDGTIDSPYVISNNDFIINNGDKYTTKKDVVLNIMSGNASKMCISNSVSCDEYIDFSNKVNWKLSGVDGTKKVYVYLKDNKGKLLSKMSQKIILDSVGPTNNKLEVVDKTANKVTLNITSNGAEAMCINLTDKVSECDWVPFKSEYEVILDKKDGMKTIYAFFRDKAGNVSSKSLTYDCETCNKAFTISYSFDGVKSIDKINEEKYINISNSDKYSWKIDSSNKWLGSVNSGLDNTSSTSVIKFEPSVSATLSFDYGVSSEVNYDKLTISIDSEGYVKTLVNSISGTKEGKIVNYELEANKKYELILDYTKDNKGNVGKDLGYIKNIIIK